MTQKQKPLTATQRIEQLEAAVVSMFHTVSNMASDLLGQKSQIQTLNADVVMLETKLSGTIGLIQGSLPITDENLAAAMTKIQVDRLTAVVASYVKDGKLEMVEEVPSKIADGFLVMKETTPTGQVVSHRRQLLLAELSLPIAEKLMGQKVGTALKLSDDEDANTVEILEAYKLVPMPQEAPAPQPSV